MSKIYNITKVKLGEMVCVEKKQIAGTNVSFKGQRGRIETVWVNAGFAFSHLSKGLVAVAQFAKGSYHLLVTGNNRGTVTVIKPRVGK